MPIRVTEKALEFNQYLIRSMMGCQSSNAEHLALAKRALQDALAHDLTPRQRQIVLMHFYEQQPVMQIAQELQLDKSTVSRTLTRAKNRLRRSMRVYFDYVNFRLDA